MLIRILKSVFYKQARKQARKIIGNKSEEKKIVDDAEDKVGQFKGKKGRFSSFFDKLSAILRLLKAYIFGEYKQLPWSVLFRLFTALIYFVAIVDFIPDFIFFFGYLDDLAVISWVFASIEKELKKFEAWEEEQKLINEAEKAQQEVERKPEGGAQ